MRNLNNGPIRTESNCVGCNKCIAPCPVIGANVSSTRMGRKNILVDSEKCIDCGECVKVCKNGARNYADDTELFLKELNSGKRMSLLVDPTFYILYKEKAAGVLGYLKSLGIEKIYDVGIGAEISAWAHVSYLRSNRNNKERAYVANFCPAVINYFEQQEPLMLSNLIPVHSPTICTAIYAVKYENDENELALLSPCPARKDEMVDAENIIKYNVTMKKLMKALDSVPTDTFCAVADYETSGFGKLVIPERGFNFIPELFLERDEVIFSHTGIDNHFFEAIRKMKTSTYAAPLFVDSVNCRMGCLSGPGTGANSDIADICDRVEELKEALKESVRGTGDTELNFEKLCKLCERFELSDFERTYKDKFKQQTIIPEKTYDSIFMAMHKDTPEKRSLDCGSCGYDTCREMAQAIACGYDKMENCIHYMNDELLLRYYADPLTKLNNKEGFRAAVNKLYASNPDKEYVIGVASINQLNLINDLHGFSYGDTLICRAARIAENFTGDGGACGRLGAGEFLLCIENRPELLYRIHNAKTYSFDEFELSFPLSFRAGLYVDSDRRENLDTMINYASLARDKIEEDGISTCLYYDNELKERLAAEAMVTSQMYAALNNHEFAAYFQPQFSHRSGKIVGAEMLCRWIKKDGSVISPGLFIPIFEKNGFIKELDKYMWELAFKTISEWVERRIPLVPISVNVSRVSLNEKDFVPTIRMLYEKYNIDQTLLHFEITESAYSDKQELVERKVNEIRKLGFLVAMDDFGSGYSSLNVLKDMPLDILKLDMGFLRGKNKEKGESIIRNVVAMIRELNLSMVSEGVETLEQADFLKHVGCDIIQGFLYSRPVPQADYENMIIPGAFRDGPFAVRNVSL